MRQSVLFIFLLSTFGCSSKFDKELWLKNQNSNPDNPRFAMIDDLSKNYLKKGMGRSEIVKLLGSPAYDTIDNPYDYTYEIGSNPGLHIDPYFLVIEFDSSGRLSNFRTEEH
jgi:outer membrane protein assembly factor BamE (lipoprotein component of BamABCDE complex)